MSDTAGCWNTLKKKVRFYPSQMLLGKRLYVSKKAQMTALCCGNKGVSMLARNGSGQGRLSGRVCSNWRARWRSRILTLMSKSEGREEGICGARARAEGTASSETLRQGRKSQGQQRAVRVGRRGWKRWRWDPRLDEGWFRKRVMWSVVLKASHLGSSVGNELGDTPEWKLESMLGS